MMHTYRLIHARAARSKIRVPLVWYWHLGVKPQDVFLASYPRSGSTWLRFMLFEILCGEDPGFRRIEHRLPEIQWHRGAPPILPGGGRLIKTHEQYRKDYKRAVLLVRDVRDVFLSAYAMSVEFGLAELVSKGDFDSFMEAFINGKALQMGTWQAHTRSWLGSPLAKDGNLLIVKYEELRKNPESKLAELLRFVGITPNMQVIHKAVEDNSLQRMRAKEDSERKAGEKSILLSPNKNVGEETRFVRKGSVGGWRDKLTDAQLEFIDRYAGDVLMTLGYERRPVKLQQTQPEVATLSI
jgi:hypothetical protein